MKATGRRAKPERAARTDRSVLVVLLAGGKGTRFWPASRLADPKQFLPLLGERSLLQMTWDRFVRIVPRERILVVTGRAYVERVRSELPDLDRRHLLVEPSGHDTAPAAALAARSALELIGDPLLVVAPTDHYIRDEAAFARALARGLDAAAEGALVTFGIVPDRAATTYGYIEAGDPEIGGRDSLQVLRFHEKPEAARAEAYLATGKFFWNAGIFAWSARAFAEELAAASPGLAEGLASLPEASRPGEPGYAAFEAAWERLPSISIDYALMERARRVVVVPLAAGWSDVGGWDAVRDLLPADEAGNRPAPDVLYIGARRCSVHRAPRRVAGVLDSGAPVEPAAFPDAPHPFPPHGPTGAGREREADAGVSGVPPRENESRPSAVDERCGMQEIRAGGGPIGAESSDRPPAPPRRLFALVDVEGLIVVETDDAVLVCREGAGENLRDVVKRLRAEGREDLL